MGEESKDNRTSWNKDNKWTQPNRPYGKHEEMSIWGVLIFGLIGATATTYALTRSQSWRGASGSSFRSAFQEEARKRYSRRMQEEYEEEMERVERIKRMQKVFKERSQFKRTYQSWEENSRGAYNQQFQREDWYWKTNTSCRDRNADYDRQTPRGPIIYPLSHHYAVLGLDRSRKTPYTDAEIKTAFRAKAMEFHPDQNQDNKEGAEAKFKQVMTSYEAIKQERKNMKS